MSLRINSTTELISYKESIPWIRFRLIDFVELKPEVLKNLKIRAERSG